MRRIMMDRRLSAAGTIGALVLCSAAIAGEPGKPAGPTTGGAGDAGADWRSAEAPMLTDHVQLTFPKDFVKAGEQYFSPDGQWLIFQAVPVPAEGAAPDSAYSMYVARVKWEGEGEKKRIVGLDTAWLQSAPGSANTCGFFHPREPWRVIFGSTITKPGAESAGGYQRGTNKYRWSFPDEMEIVEATVPVVWEKFHAPDGSKSVSAAPAGPIYFKRNGYDAECAFSPNGRYIVHSSVDPETLDADIFVYDTLTKKRTAIVKAPGYDGGPFFSPSGKSICYRSDRAGNDLLQVFIADLEFTHEGEITGTKNERKVTDNEHVNWGPFWHPSGAFLVYATSEVGHSNYEVFSVEAPVGDNAAKGPTELKRKRVTHAPGFDGLPAFTNDGKWMVWTSQRGEKTAKEDRPSSQVWAARVVDVRP